MNQDMSPSEAEKKHVFADLQAQPRRVHCCGGMSSLLSPISPRSQNLDLLPDSHPAALQIKERTARGFSSCPQRVEAAYKRLNLVAQIFVYGNSFESQLVAVVVPDEATFVPAANKEGITGSFEEIVANPQAKALLQKQLDATAKEAKLKVHLTGVPYRST